MSRAFLAETVKRLPFIVAVLAMLYMVQFYRLSVQTANNGKVANEILQQVAKLAEDNKKLAQQGRDINKSNQEHIDCMLGLFASYLNDIHERRTVGSVDLATCKTTSSTTTDVEGSGAASSSQTAPTANQPTASQTAPQKPTSPSQPNGSQGQEGNPSFLRRLAQSVVDLPTNLLHGLTGR